MLKRDELTDRAAALTYYGILALFPALLALVSLLGVVGRSATQQVLDNIETLAPGPAQDILRDAVRQMQGRAGLGSAMAVVGLVLAVWSASGYVAAFIRSANAVYDVPEGRPLWKVLPVRVGMTVVLMVMAVISALTAAIRSASSTATSWPRRAGSRAVPSPATPPPTTATSTERSLEGGGAGALPGAVSIRYGPRIPRSAFMAAGFPPPPRDTHEGADGPGPRAGPRRRSRHGVRNPRNVTCFRLSKPSRS